MSPSIYLDHNATTPLDPVVAEAMARAWKDCGGNPASQHAAGRKARRMLEECREGIVALLGGKTNGMDADRLIFTSGGTEANNLALFGVGWDKLARAERAPAHQNTVAHSGGPAPASGGLVPPYEAGSGDPRLTGGDPRRTVVISAIEHPSITGAAEELARRGTRIVKLPVTADGVVQAAALDEVLQPAISNPQSEIHLVSVMLANNETGVIQPVRELAEKCRAAGVPLHTDAVQAVGKIPVDFRDLGVAAMTVAPHKFHGPLGIGGLLVRQDVQLQPLLFGGFQQSALRPGTEPVALAVGFFTALKQWHDEAEQRQQRMTSLRDQLETLLLAGAPDAVIIGATAPRLPHTTNIAFPGINRQALVMALDMAGVACATGSACASGSSEPSPVLLAMGLEKPLVEGSIRLSLGALTTADEVAEAGRRILKCVKDLRRAK